MDRQIAQDILPPEMAPFNEVQMLSKFADTFLKDTDFQKTLKSHIITPVIKQLFRDSPQFLLSIVILFLLQIILTGVSLAILIIKLC